MAAWMALRVVDEAFGTDLWPDGSRLRQIRCVAETRSGVQGRVVRGWTCAENRFGAMTRTG